MNKKLCICLMVLSLSLVSTLSWAGSSDEWIGKAVGAASELAQGNVGSAAQNALPSAQMNLKQTNLYLQGTSAGLNQNIPQLQRFSNPYFGVSGNYGAQTQFNSGRPTVSQGVNVNTGNKYLSNTTRLGKN